MSYPPTNRFLFEPRKVPPEKRSLGRFRLLHELGSGGMATLFMATDEMGRITAVKRLHPHLAAEQALVEMFRDEAAIAARITHPNVCKVHGLEQEAGQLYIVMEYVHGESLAALLQQFAARSQQLPLDAALHLMGQACLGLQAAHELRDEEGRLLHVVHRDIGPQNLLISYDGELKVVDFGLAAAASQLHTSITGAVKGTLPYMAPEQAMGKPVDSRTDIFSLGAVIYEAVCGQQAFPTPGPGALMQRTQGVATRPSELCPDLPPAVEQIILRALAVRPEERYPSASALYRDLYNYLISAPRGTNTRAVGELTRRAFAQRYALREELLSLAFTAPDVLEEEELALDLADPMASAYRCDYCGAQQPDKAQLDQHINSCPQRKWWVQNFGGSRQLAGLGDSSRQRPAAAPPAVTAPPPGGLWQRLRQRLSPHKRDPLVVRLQGIEARLQTVRHYVASALADRAMVSMWGMVAEIGENKPAAERLLGRLKPRLVRCAAILLGVALEVENNAAFLATQSDRAVKEQVATLEARLQQTTAVELQRELEATIRRTRGLVAERERLAQRNELLLLRLESMVAAIEVTQGKVLEITASAVVAELEATTQITVFFDSLLLEVEQLAASVREVERV